MRTKGSTLVCITVAFALAMGYNAALLLCAASAMNLFHSIYAVAVACFLWSLFALPAVRPYFKATQPGFATVTTFRGVALHLVAAFTFGLLSGFAIPLLVAVGISDRQSAGVSR